MYIYIYVCQCIYVCIPLQLIRRPRHLLQNLFRKILKKKKSRTVHELFDKILTFLLFNMKLFFFIFSKIYLTCFFYILVLCITNSSKMMKFHNSTMGEAINNGSRNEM